MLIISLVILLQLGIASATTTEIKIKTLPFHDVQVTPFGVNVDNTEAITIFRGKSDKYGDITFNLDSPIKEFTLIIYIKWLDETVAKKNLEESYNAGEPVYLEVAPAGARLIPTPQEKTTEELEISPETELVSEETETTVTGTDEETSIKSIQEETTEETDSAEKGITGLIVYAIKNKGSTVGVYTLIAIVIIAFLLFIFRTRKKIEKKAETFLTQNKDDRLIYDLEDKIHQAQKELNLLKNEEKIKQAESRLRKDQEELEKLKLGEN